MSRIFILFLMTMDGTDYREGPCIPHILKVSSLLQMLKTNMLDPAGLKP